MSTLGSPAAINNTYFTKAANWTASKDQNTNSRQQSTAVNFKRRDSQQESIDNLYLNPLRCPRGDYSTRTPSCTADSHVHWEGVFTLNPC